MVQKSKLEVFIVETNEPLDNAKENKVRTKVATGDFAY